MSAAAASSGMKWPPDGLLDLIFDQRFELLLDLFVDGLAQRITA